MWMNGSSRARSTPAKARRTGKPSPSNPDGAVVTDATGRATAAVGAGSGARGRARRSSAVTAGMTTPLLAMAGRVPAKMAAAPGRTAYRAATIVDRATFPSLRGATQDVIMGSL